MLAFVHIEKTAGTTINLILRQSFGVRHCDVLYRNVCDEAVVAQEIAFVRWCHPGLMSIAGHGLLPRGIDDTDIHLYTFLRDPVARCISHYQYQVQVMGKQISFVDWLRIDKYQNMQTKKLVGAENPMEAKILLKDRFLFVGLVERFDESIQALAAVSPYPLNTVYKIKNVARDHVLRQQLLSEPRTRNLIEDANQADIEIYGYVKNELCPKLIKNSPAPRQSDQTSAPVRYWSNVAFRNIVYKPLHWLLR